MSVRHLLTSHMRILFCCFLPLGVLDAQYVRSPRDTIRLREVTATTTTVETPQGALELKSEHDAVIAITFGAKDSARAWYESLRIASSSPRGKQEPSTDAALRLPFVLEFDARGQVKTLAAPTFPATFQGISDLTSQFDDFFVRLPGQPLHLGLTWTDTTTTSRSSGESRSVLVKRGAYRVLRDTLVSGEPAYVISVTQEIENRSSQPVQGLTATSTLIGSDQGIIVFSKAGRLLGRQRQGDLRGEITYTGGSSPVRMPQRIQYGNSVTSPPGRQ